MGANLLAYGKKVAGLQGEVREWKYLGQTSGNAEISIPDDATEVIGYALYSTNVGSQFQFATIQDDLWVRQGYYHNSTNYGAFIFSWTKSTRKAKLFTFGEIGTDKTSQTTTKWYVK